MPEPMRSPCICCASHWRCYTRPRFGIGHAAPSSGRRLRALWRGRKACDERRGPGNPVTSTLPMSERRHGGLVGVGGRPTGSRVAAATVGTRSSPYSGTYAALDLGTNNCRLLVARPVGDSFRVIDAFSPHHPAGRGITASGRNQRGRHRARGRCARHLPRQDEESRRHPRPADRD